MQRLTIDVECADAMQFPADVLGLKFAQDLWGLDYQVVSKLNEAGYTGLLKKGPIRGESILIPSYDVIAAPYILIVGIDSIRTFDYSSSRHLGYRFVSSLTEHQQAADFEHLAITVHGVGFGLSLHEAFRAELLGIADAFQKGEFPPTLRKITFVERRTDVARVMEAELATMIEAHPAVRTMVKGVEETAKQSAKRSAPPAEKFVFVSYARNDESIALRIVDDLRQEQFPVWIDQININPGAHWDKTIQEALRNSHLMLLILTNESGQSDNVADEYHYFLTNNKPIIPILVEPFDMQHMPYRLSRRLYIDFRGDYNLSLKKLVDTLHAELNRI